MLLEREIDAVTFTSASTVRHFVEMLGAEQCRRPAPRHDGRGHRAGHRGGGRSSSASKPPSCPRSSRFRRSWMRSSIYFRRAFGACNGTLMTKHLHNPAATGIDQATGLGLRHRPRRLRRSAAIRALVRETRLSADMFIYPLFVCSGEGQRREVASMPGVFQLSVDEAVREAAAAKADGVPGVLLFGLPDDKDAVGSAASDPDAPVQAAVRAIKREVPGLLVVTDVCLCEYTSHGHCGVLAGEEIVNDATVEQLARAALSHAVAGADIVAPSDMMDGRVGRIRDALDDAGCESGRHHVVCREVLLGVLRSVPRRRRIDAGLRRSPLAPDGSRQRAKRRCARSTLDIEEGADIVMVKPAMTYLDVIARVKAEFGLPTAAYHVSGEYAMLKAAAQQGWIDEPRAMMETLTAIKRAGADIIITYYAREAARAL